MSQSGMAPLVPRSREHSPDELSIVGEESERRVLLGALDDDDCRAILRATNHETLTASEISEACDLPLSTTYRKLDVLAEAGLVTERTRIRRSGKHTSEYARNVDDVMVSIEPDGGVEMWVSRREPEERPRWSKRIVRS